MAQIALSEMNKLKCPICLEEVDSTKIFKIGLCHHRFCYSCMRKHVTAKVSGRELPRCPQTNCGSALDIDSTCKKFLARTMYPILDQMVKESSIPAKEKVYCPNPKCSKLMSKTEALKNNRSLIAVKSKVELSQGRCLTCHTIFCVDCKVIWHSNKSCAIYKKCELLDFESADAKLKFLAQQKKWIQCPICSHMVELAHGCYHMFCRCGHQFCYLCGKEWEINRTACSSSCALWAEENIIHG